MRKTQNKQAVASILFLFCVAGISSLLRFSYSGTLFFSVVPLHRAVEIVRNGTNYYYNNGQDPVDRPVDDDSIAWNASLSEVTIVCQLSGEMCNNLGKLGHCLAVKLWLEREYFIAKQQHDADDDIHIHIMIRHQEHPKWRRGRDALQQCFPATRILDFSEANTDEFRQRIALQNEWIFGTSSKVGERMTPFDGINEEDVGLVEQALEFFVNRTSSLGAKYYHRRDSSSSLDDVTANFTTGFEAKEVTTKKKTIQILNDDDNNNSNNNNTTRRRTISMPFLYANRLLTTDVFVDRYYDDFRRYFAFDSQDGNCCNLVPDPDESVFHFRDFITEMPRKGKSLGFSELGPNQTAIDLFGHLLPGDKVAIVTRFSANPLVQTYVQALQERGLVVRVIQNQTGEQDFCFLMKAQKEMIGIVYSTYLFWAGLLSNCTRVLAYSLDTVERQRSGRPVYMHYNWTHPELKSKMVFRVIKPYDQE